ncbi:helix-turn-helix transcriptional regulator [Nocardioides zhouii]|uniref:XRE family transcriptional regulator n=1 Tax=Nocardioides zhouii TaxID=1168729 RepID=A0A4Q2T5I0_9ACTN|nr:helix-turn-helix transcriptional regulator [Nocardioides zhouii]RYC13293.1 XRE family transcriptional regulator [Nocardioides zhouii]
MEQARRPDVRWAYEPAELGRAVRGTRQERGLTQQELAERLGVGRMTISRLERGDSVSVETAMRALSECGYAIAVAPKFTRLVAQPRTTHAVADESSDG